MSKIPMWGYKFVYKTCFTANVRGLTVQTILKNKPLYDSFVLFDFCFDIKSGVPT
jgi:hypothetical protein